MKLKINSNWFKVLMKLTKVEYGQKLLLKGVPVIYNKKGATLKIGDNVTIKSSFLSNLVGMYARTIIITRTPEATIEIGEDVGISGATIYARKSIKIGAGTLIGANTKILDNDFHPIDLESRRKDIKEEIRAKEIVIGNDCFVGCNVIILKGTVLGEGCVVGAGAVVSGKFESGSVIVGNPGRVVRVMKLV